MHMSHLIDHIYFLKGLAVEGLDSDLHCIVDLLVALSDSCIDDLVSRETAVVSMQNLVSADAVSSETLAADVLEQSAFHVGLHGIMYLDAILFRHFCGIIHCLVQQVHVVVIERSGYLVKFFYCIKIQHLTYIVSKHFGLFCPQARKTIAKIAKKSVNSQTPVNNYINL